MPSSTDISKLIINTVPSQEIYDEMVEQDLVEDNQIYLVGGEMIPPPEIETGQDTPANGIKAWYKTNIPAGTGLYLSGDTTSMNFVTGQNVTWATGTEKYGDGYFPGSKAFEFDGTNCMEVPYSESIDISSGDFTIGMWVKIESGHTTDHTLLSFRNGTETHWVSLVLGKGTVQTDGTQQSTVFFYTPTPLTYNENNNRIALGAMYLDKWNYLMIVREQNRISGFINGYCYTGNYYNSKSLTESLSIVQNTPLKIGAEGNTNNTYKSFCKGYISDLFIAKGVVCGEANFFNNIDGTGNTTHQKAFLPTNFVYIQGVKQNNEL